ncbi:MAG: nickel pincer cofactor biosynthesis protein LarB [Actinomycetota bacterium]|nr:nickel pincer cofactor biosynthesis protein LarB [Actinomycetota bacterium]
MDIKDWVMEILSKVEMGGMSASKAFESLKFLTFSDLEFAKVDHLREIRQGFCEVVFCEGKSIDQITKITESLLENNAGNIMLTRAGEEVFRAVEALDKRATYHPEAKAITITREAPEEYGLVSVLSAGTSDIGVAEEARITANLMGSKVETFYDVGVAGVHRLSPYLEALDKSNAIVVAAGMDGTLASLVGGLASCPVIAVPTSIGYGASMGGLAALLSMLNCCAPGVAVVNIDNGFGAGYFAGLVNKMVSGVPR